MAGKPTMVRVRGVLQDWDIHDNRFDIAEVAFDIDLAARGIELTDEQAAEIEDDGFYGAGADNALGELVFMAYDNGWADFGCPRWEWEDPCELHARVERGE